MVLLNLFNCFTYSKVPLIKNHLDYDNKYALIIGINYEFDKTKKLNGCINDAMNIIDLLVKEYNYNTDNISLLCDCSNIKPTKKNIINKIKYYINKLEENDLFLFYFSGHGIKCGLITYDLGCLFNYELREHLVNKIPKTSHLIGIIDSCYSENCFILPYYLFGNKIVKYNINFNNISKNITLLTACSKNQYAIDDNNGVLTENLINILKKEKNISIIKLLSLLKLSINIKYKQIPQLCCSDYINIYLPFHN